jgi:hypothetical protein
VDGGERVRRYNSSLLPTKGTFGAHFGLLRWATWSSSFVRECLCISLLSGILLS